MTCCPPFITTCSEIASRFEPRTIRQEQEGSSAVIFEITILEPFLLLKNLCYAKSIE